jgi:nitrogen fixation protein NifX
VIGNVQRLMQSTPPLWVRRCMRGPGGKRLSLDDQEV